jgi:hypothetical protein
VNSFLILVFITIYVQKFFWLKLKVDIETGPNWAEMEIRAQASGRRA